MTLTYKCISCNKRFYFFGNTEKALFKQIEAREDLERGGFDNVDSAWKVIEKHAKCCKKPLIVLEGSFLHKKVT